MADAERARLRRADAGGWRRWGPYLSERAWGTVREDYSAGGDAWDSFPHDHARSRTYRWNEDGLAGLCDEQQRLCFSLALWNGADPILKERAFGLTGNEGDHGEDVKEYWWYEDATPTHSWLSWRYAYPQRAFPYDDLVRTNAARSRDEPEYELLDTGAFDDDRWFDVRAEYAKAGADDVCIRIRIVNRGPERADLHVLPTLWFRDTWSWGTGDPVPVIRGDERGLVAEHATLGTAVLLGDGEPLLCDNATNTRRLYGADGPAYPKDGIADHVLHGLPTVNPAGTGTKGALHSVLSIEPGATAELRLRLRVTAPGGKPAAVTGTALSTGFDRVLAARKADADEFYEALCAGATPEEARVVRTAAAGMIWSKQFYAYTVRTWLDGDPGQPVPPPERLHGRNARWRSFETASVVSMPDPWEYPWFAAWDLAFHCVTFAEIDPAFAKQQLAMVLGTGWMHPTGQVPAYEWDFGAVNPPVHAWAALKVFRADGGKDVAWLRRVFERLVVNHTWWVGRNDPEGDGTYSGGFLGMDNIGPFDRGAPLPDGFRLEQADATGWMALFSLSMLEIAVELARTEPALTDMALFFFDHFALIAGAAVTSGLWHEGDGFFYDQLVRDDGTRWPVDVRSMSGLVPLLAVAALPADRLAAMPALRERMAAFEARHPRAASGTEVSSPADPGAAGLLALVDRERLERVLRILGDPAQLLSPHGVRSVSAAYRGAPYVFHAGADDGTSIDYEPAESTTALFGGNSNWRGPVWMPVNVLLLDALQRYGSALGDAAPIEYPAGSGRVVPVSAVAADLADRLTGIYLPRADGTRPVWGGAGRFRDDPLWRDALLFFEYFQGDDGAGLGATHQTGWTGLLANVLLDRIRARRAD